MDNFLSGRQVLRLLSQVSLERQIKSNVTNGAGSITLSLPQSINTGATPTFASETLTATTNQLVLGTTNTTTISAPAPASSITLTLPNTADTIVGRATIDTLSNKTLSSPAVTGTLAIKGSTSGSVSLAVPAVAGSDTITLPAGTTNFSTTGGTGQVVPNNLRPEVHSLFRTVSAANLTGNLPVTNLKMLERLQARRPSGEAMEPGLLLQVFLVLLEFPTEELEQEQHLRKVQLYSLVHQVFIRKTTLTCIWNDSTTSLGIGASASPQAICDVASGSGSSVLIRTTGGGGVLRIVNSGMTNYFQSGTGVGDGFHGSNAVW